VRPSLIAALRRFPIGSTGAQLAVDRAFRLPEGDRASLRDNQVHPRRRAILAHRILVRGQAHLQVDRAGRHRHQIVDEALLVAGIGFRRPDPAVDDSGARRLQRVGVERLIGLAERRRPPAAILGRRPIFAVQAQAGPARHQPERADRLALHVEIQMEVADRNPQPMRAGAFPRQHPAIEQRSDHAIVAVIAQLRSVEAANECIGAPS